MRPMDNSEQVPFVADMPRARGRPAEVFVHGTLSYPQAAIAIFGQLTVRNPPTSH
jgi:hypothetical protein